MVWLILGLAAFLGIHLLPAGPPLRTALAQRFGENRYKGIFSAASGIGLVLIIVGYAYAPRGAQLFEPLAAARSLAPLAMVVSFILLAAANMKAHIRRALKHPQLIGVGIWSATHLLANGHLKAGVLFGAFLAYVAIDLVSAITRGATKSFQPLVKHDIIAVAGGTLVALVVMALHRLLFGVPAVAWGL